MHSGLCSSHWDSSKEDKIPQNLCNNAGSKLAGRCLSYISEGHYKAIEVEERGSGVLWVWGQAERGGFSPRSQGKAS